MLKNSGSREAGVPGQQYSSGSDPKNKTGEKSEAVVNTEDENNYDENENKELKEKDKPANQDNIHKDFEYSESGEFNNDSFVTDSNPNDEYL